MRTNSDRPRHVMFARWQWTLAMALTYLGAVSSARSLAQAPFADGGRGVELAGTQANSGATSTQLIVRIAADRAEVELHVDDAPTAGAARAGAPGIDAIKVELDGKALTPAANSDKTAPERGWSSLKVGFGSALDEGAHRLSMSGLIAANEAALDVTVVTLEGVRLVLASPAPPAAMAVTALPTGERVQLRYPRFSGQDLRLGLQATQESGVMSWLQKGSDVAAPLVSAIVILFCTTWVERWFSIRGTQLEELHLLRAQLPVGSNTMELEERQKFIDSVRALRAKGLYAGFAESYTKPLEEILARGNVQDVPFYRQKLGEVKPGVRPTWVFFRPRS